MLYRDFEIETGVLLAVLGYFGGCFLASYYLPLWCKGIDVTAAPADHNPGAANAFSAAGVPFGFLCLLVDLAKGFLPAAAGVHLLGLSSPWLALVLAAPIAGHAFPVQRHFRGGKGIAVSFGVTLGLLPLWMPFAILAALYIFFSVIPVVSPHRTRSIVTFALWAVAVCRLVPLRGVALASILIGVIVIFRHVHAAAEKAPEVHLFKKA